MVTAGLVYACIRMHELGESGGMLLQEDLSYFKALGSIFRSEMPLVSQK